MHVVICGGGAIGCSIAYFLSQRGAEVTVVERTGVANAASGKSGGFLALDWCDGGPLQHLARRSFALHAELAETLGGEAWNYRRMTTYGGLAGYSVGSDDGPVAWVSDSVAIGQTTGSPGDDGAGASRRLHQGNDAGGRGQRRHAHRGRGHRHPCRGRQGRRRGDRRRDACGRRGGGCAGPVVDPGG